MVTTVGPRSKPVERDADARVGQAPVASREFIMEPERWDGRGLAAIKQWRR